MVQQDKMQTVLQDHFARIKSRNSAYTLRSFAVKLQISSGALSEIMAGRRRVSVKLAHRLADSLMLDPEEKTALFNTDKGAPQVNDTYLKLTSDQFHMISEWYHFAILSLLKTKNFKSDFSWFADRLGLPEKTVALAMGRLLRLGLVAQDMNGNLRRTSKKLRTSDEVANISVRRAHFETLSLAAKSLEIDPVEARDFTSVTLPADFQKLPEAKVLIREFQDKLSALLENGNAQEVYRLAIQLFPLTNLEK